MTRGPKPKPGRLKLLEGNPGRRKILDEIQVEKGIPDKPDYLSDYASEMWDELIAILPSTGLLSTIDKGILAACCSWYGIHRKAMEEIKTLDSLVSITEKGNTIQNPLIGIANVAGVNFIRAGEQIAIGFVARQRLAIDNSKKASKFEGLIGIEGGKKERKNAKYRPS